MAHRSFELKERVRLIGIDLWRARDKFGYDSVEARIVQDALDAACRELYANNPHHDD